MGKEKEIPLVLEQVKGKIVTEVVLKEDWVTQEFVGEEYNPVLEEIDSITISFDLFDKDLVLVAEPTCCETTWFGFPSDPKTALVGRSIVDVKESHYGEEPEVPFGKQEDDQQRKVKIFFSDGTHFKFFRNTSSNGYYSGYLTLSLREKK